MYDMTRMTKSNKIYQYKLRKGKTKNQTIYMEI